MSTNMDPAEYAKALASIVKQFVAKELAPLQKRLDELEGERARSLADAFQGVWLPQRTFKRGALVQHAGSAWIALADTEAKPGEGEGWRLLLKGAR